MPEDKRDSQEFNKEAIVNEVVDKLTTSQSQLNHFLIDFNYFMQTYKGDRKTHRRTDGFTITSVPETAQAVETLTGMVYAMLTSSDPFFETLPMRADISYEQSYAITQLHRFQMDRVEYKRNLLMGLRELFLMGLGVWEEQWVSWPNTKNAVWEATEFRARPLITVAFPPGARNLDTADWIITTDIVSPYQINNLSMQDEAGVAWKKDEIKQAISEADDIAKLSGPVRERLNQSGYSRLGKVMELLTYWGPLEHSNDNTDWCIGILNRAHIIRFHKNPFAAGYRPFRSASFIEIPMEPYPMGVGLQTKELQRLLDANRERTMDIITFSLFSMMKLSRFAGVKPSQLQVRPWHIIEMDDIHGLEPLRPDLNAVSYGIKLEEILKEDFRNLTGATPVLQALPTDSTATEARISQNNSVRRIANIAEIIGDRVVRQHLQFAHKNNIQFLDKPIWFMVTGMEKPMKVSKKDIMAEVDFVTRIVTDKDFRPKRVQELNALLQIVTSIRNNIPNQVDVIPIIQEQVRALGFDPMSIIKPVMPQLSPELSLQNLMSRAGAVNREVGLAQGALAPEPTLQATPVGPVSTIP